MTSAGICIHQMRAKFFLINKSDLKKYKLASGFDEMFKVFENDNLNEFMSVEENGNWVRHIY